MNLPKLHDRDAWVKEQLAELIAAAESGEEWAEICRQEQELINQWDTDHGQFGVGA